MDFEYDSCGGSKKGRHQDNLFSGLDMLSTFLYSMIVATFLVLLPLESFFVWFSYALVLFWSCWCLLQYHSTFVIYFVVATFVTTKRQYNNRWKQRYMSVANALTIKNTTGVQARSLQRVTTYEAYKSKWKSVTNTTCAWMMEEVTSLRKLIF